MSLSTFHLFFITVSTLVALGAGAWGVSTYGSEDSVPALVFGLLSLAAVPVLVVYGVKVRTKLKSLPP